MAYRIKISKLDQDFSKHIRTKANNKCEYCGRYKDFKQLQTAHCFGRRYKNVRYDPENVAALCFTCHRKIDEDAELKREFFIKRLGERGYKLLRIRAYDTGKPDLKAIELWLQSQMK